VVAVVLLFVCLFVVFRCCCLLLRQFFINTKINSSSFDIASYLTVVERFQHRFALDRMRLIGLLPFCRRCKHRKHRKLNQKREISCGTICVCFYDEIRMRLRSHLLLHRAQRQFLTMQYEQITEISNERRLDLDFRGRTESTKSTKRIDTTQNESS
jgi:hypothetical protein